MATQGKNTPREPFFITPQSVLEMTIEDMEHHLEGVRERRLKSFHVYQQAEEEKRVIREGRLKTRMEKLCSTLANDFLRLDKSVERIEKRVNDLRVIRLELGYE